jgi:hypothetical protein
METRASILILVFAWAVDSECFCIYLHIPSRCNSIVLEVRNLGSPQGLLVMKNHNFLLGCLFHAWGMLFWAKSVMIYTKATCLWDKRRLTLSMEVWVKVGIMLRLFPLCWPYCTTQCIHGMIRVVPYWKPWELNSRMENRTQSHKLQGEWQAGLVTHQVVLCGIYI